MHFSKEISCAYMNCLNLEKPALFGWKGALIHNTTKNTQQGNTHLTKKGDPAW